MPAPTLLFLAPPSFGDDDAPAGPPAPTPAVEAPARPVARGRRPAGALRMTRGAREAATGMAVTDADVQRCLDGPDDVSPDERTPSRTRFRRGGLVVLAAADGMVLRVDRRSR